MAKNIFFKATTKKSILLLFAICLISFVLLFMTACGNSNKDVEDETFTKTETDTLFITNGTFEYGTADAGEDEFPYNSNGWSHEADNSATSSYVASGIIDTETSKFTALLDNLYEDNDYKYFLLRNYFATDAGTTDVLEIQTYLKNLAQTAIGNDASNEDIDNWVKNTVLTRAQGLDASYTEVKEFIKNPNSAPTANSKDHKVYMLNNYQQYSSSLNYFSLGTAQKITSDTNISLNAGEYGKLIIWVKTTNLTSINTNFGANIRLINSISGVNQEQYQISNINTNCEWQQYTIYVQAADFSATSLKVVLGLGYGNGSANKTMGYCEGTAFFDDIYFEKFDNYTDFVTQLNADNISVDSTNTDMTGTNVITAINYASYNGTNTDDAVQIVPNEFSGTATNKLFFSYYDMTLNSYLDKVSGRDYFTQLTNGTNYNFGKNGVTISTADEGGNISGDRFSANTTANTLTIGTLLDASSPAYNKEALTINVNKASYNFEIKSNAFAVKSGDYLQVSFYVNTKLLDLDRTGLSVYLYDVETANTYNKASDHITLLTDSITTEDDEWTMLTYILLNNFPDNSVKYFYLSFYVGPTNVATQNDPSYYPTGEITIADLKYSTGPITQTDSFGNDNPNYDIYYLFNSISDSTLSSNGLYAGYTADYVGGENVQTYTFNEALNSLGTIQNGFAQLEAYTGVNANSKYVNENGTNYTINNPSVNKNASNEVITYAGLMNSKYFASNTYNLNSYAVSQGYADTADMVGWVDDITNDNDNVQPLTIYNKEATNYGYIGKAQTLAANNTITISLKVKVVGGATAYLYLVDMNNDSDTRLSVLNQSFTSNYGQTAGQEINNELYIKVDKALCEQYGDNEGWLTVYFYLASGNNDISYRIELWNGDRSGTNNSAGLVLFDSYASGDNFTEGDIYTSGSPLSNALIEGKITANSIIKYTRQLTKAETEFNSSAKRANLGYAEVEYDATAVWCADTTQNGTRTFVYAIYNTINPTEIDPWAQYEEEKEDEDTEEKAGCIDFSSEAFWLNLASILLAVALFIAIFMVVVKAIRKRKLNSNKNIKSHYTVSSRNAIKKKPVEPVVSDNLGGYEGEEEITPNENEFVNKVEDDAETANDDTEITYEKDVNEKEEFIYGEVLEDFTEGVETTDDDNKDK